MNANELIRRIQDCADKVKGNVAVVYDYDDMDVNITTVELVDDKKNAKIRIS